MRRFELVEPPTLEDACAYLAGDPAAKAIGGGTALLILIKQGVFFPTTLVNLRKIDGASSIVAEDGWLRIGALATIGDVERSDLVRRVVPVLADACHTVANIRIRNMATMGGNLAHGDHQSDPPGALVALDARVVIAGPGTDREMPLTAFLRGGYETALEAGELVSAIRVPPAEPGWTGAYLKFTTGSSEERPLAGVTARLRLDGDRCTDARLVVGAAGPVPIRVTAAEELARGRRASADLFRDMGAAVAEVLDPIDDVRASAGYRRRIAVVLAERALTASFAGRTAA